MPEIEAVKIRILLPKTDWHQYSAETVWTIPVGINQYTLDNSPFFTDDLSYMDTVYAEKESEGDFPVFKYVVSRGGHSTCRVVLSEETSLEKFEQYFKPLDEIGCSYEGFQKKQFAVDVPAETNIDHVFELLEKGKEDGVWFLHLLISDIIRIKIASSLRSSQ
jgi:hypothetical protein